MAAGIERVHVLGGAGGGKTTIARQLAESWGLPHHEIDPVLEIDAVTLGDRWVTDGIFLWHVERLLEPADLVVWVDMPLRVCLTRIVRRHVLASIRRDNPHRGIRKLARFLREVRRAYHDPSGRLPNGPRDFAALTRSATE